MNIENKHNTIDSIPLICIVGKLDCPKVNLCRHMVNDIAKKKIGNVKFEFILAFETPFDFLVEELIKENIDFLEFKFSPIIYIQDPSTKKKEIIGSLDHFLKYLIVNYGHYEEKNDSLFREEATALLRNYMKTSGHKYCFFDISIAGKALNRVVIQLFHNDLPITCENFLSLCKGFSNEKKEKVSFKDTTFHRVVKSGYIQGGDLSSLTNGNKSIYKGEFADEGYNMSHGYPGVVGMVKKGKRKHSNECQFYITLTSLKAFDNLFVAFGRVVQGFNSIKEIENSETNLQRPNMKIVIDKCGEYQI